MSTYKRYVVEPAVTAGDASTVRVYWALRVKAPKSRETKRRNDWLPEVAMRFMKRRGFGLIQPRKLYPDAVG
jgi:hypothetical protein